MNNIENIKKMIEDAKLENDEVLIEYLTKALNHLLEKQKLEEDIKLKSQEKVNEEQNTITENKQEVVIEEKQEEEKKEEKPIKKQAHGEVSTITVYQNGKVSVETKYLDIPIQEKKTELISAMRRLGINLGIDDVINDHSSEEELLDILNELDSTEDVEKIEGFLKEAAQVGKKGKELLEKYNAKELEKTDARYDSEYQEILKEITLTMDNDKETNRRNVDTDKYKETIEAYEKLIKKIEALIDEAKNKMQREKIANLEMKVMQLQGRIKTMIETLKAAEEISFSFD